eukprot:jgi/Ulvmu1/438/UM001_0445.1
MFVSMSQSCSNRLNTCAPRAFKLRKARTKSDFEAVADLCASEFASSGSISDVSSTAIDVRIVAKVKAIPGLGPLIGNKGPWSDEPAEDLLERLLELDRRKREARDAQHAYSAAKSEIKATAAQARSEGRQAYADDLELLLYERARDERRKLLQWRFKRQSMVIIAQEPQPRMPAASAEPPQLAGSCAVVLKILDSALPPPFPTKQPARLYIGNLVVRETMRRKGCGTALLDAVERLGRRWRHKEVWLHVDVDNTAAIGMYHKAGYVTVKQQRERVPPFKMRYLMKKRILPSGLAAAVEPGVRTQNSTGATGAAGEGAAAAPRSVFVWDDTDL